LQKNRDIKIHNQVLQNPVVRHNPAVEAEEVLRIAAAGNPAVAEEEHRIAVVGNPAAAEEVLRIAAAGNPAVEAEEALHIAVAGIPAVVPVPVPSVLRISGRIYLNLLWHYILCIPS
jgi:hypothetical protein